MKKSTLLHLRIPFSFFLLPVFLFAVAISNATDISTLFLTFFILHILLYPASNGYNSYFDRDEKSIGGLENPPPVSKELYWASLVFDFLALLLGFLISWEFVLMIFIYGLISKAYSHPAIRLKAKPFIGWLAAGIFQGYFTYLLSYIALVGISISDTLTWQIQAPGILSSALLLGSYPMTQIYQHEEDATRGDLTISRVLGILGTFHFTAVAFSVSMGGFVYYFTSFYDLTTALVFAIVLSPILIFFITWYLRVRKNRGAADFKSTMRLNFLSAFFLNAFFIWLWIS